MLLVCTIVVVLVISGTLLAFGLRPEPSTPAIEIIWRTFMHTYDPSQVAYDEGTWTFRLIMLCACVAGTFILSTLISILTTGFDAKLNELRRGRSVVLEKGHILIIGWSAQVFSLLEEIILAHENQKDSCVVILANVDRVIMEEQITVQIANRRSTRIVCRSGSPFDATSLPLVQFADAKGIIVLPPENAENADAHTLKAILAILHHPAAVDGNFTLIAGFREVKNYEAAEIVCTGKNVKLVLTDAVIAQIIAQTCRQAGLAAVITELLGFDGDEIYIQNEPKLAGVTFGEALHRYKHSAVIGLKLSDSTIILKPAFDKIISENDSIIAISRDDDTINLDEQSAPSPDLTLISQTPPPTRRAEHFLIINTNDKLPAIIKELSHYLAFGSTVTLLRPPGTKERHTASFPNIEITSVLGDPTDRRVLDNCNCHLYNAIIVLSPDNAPTAEDADSLILITLIHLRDIIDKHDSSTTLTSEILEERNRELARIANVNDFVISNKLSSMYMTQLCENPEYSVIFADIFDAAGCEFYLKPAEFYLKNGSNTHFYTVLYAAAQRGEIAVGYITADGEITVNPMKSERRTYYIGDRIIVFSEDE